MIISFPGNTNKKIIPTSTQKYKDGGVMEKSLLGLKVNIRNQKKGIKTIEVKDFDGTFVVKLRGMNIEEVFKYTITSKRR